MISSFVDTTIKMLRGYVLRLSTQGIYLSPKELASIELQYDHCVGLMNLMEPGRDREEIKFLLDVISALLP